MGYKSHAFKGFGWMGLLRVSTRIIAFVRLGILARILTPAQFGVFGIATLFLSFLETFTETGINIFLIQRREKIDDYISSAWIVSILRGLLISSVIVISAPLVVRFFDSPESLKIVFLISLVPFIRGFINPSIVSIDKEIQFHKEFWLRSFLFLVDAAVAITVAFITRSAESMAIGLIVSAILELIISFLFFKPHPRLVFEFDKVRFIFRRSWWVTASGMFSYLSANLDDVAVGRVFGTSSLGLYQSAYKISTLPITELTQTFGKVIFPVYSKFSEDKERLIKAFKKVFSLTSVIAITLSIFIFLFADQIVMIILGEQWTAAVPLVRILAIYGAIHAVLTNFLSLFLAVGHQDYVAKTYLVRFLGLIITIVPFVVYFGLEGAAYSAVASVVFEAPFVIYFAHKVLKR